jgi:tetratricopeptide (TPR) repeat protein
MLCTHMSQTPQDQADSQPAPESPAAEQLVLTSPEQASTLRDLALWAGVLVILTLAAYGPALRGEFLWDDNRYVQPVLWVQDGMRNVWTGHLQRLVGSEEQRTSVRVYTPQYYPLTYTSYWLEYQLFGPAQGMPTSTTIFHVTNVLLHAGSAVLIWLILRRLGVPGAWVAAGVFALHPVNVESVAWITERKNVLSGVCLFGAILAYLRFAGINQATGPSDAHEADDAGRWDLYAAAVLLFAAGLLAKSVIAVLPGVLLVLLWWKGRVRVWHVALVISTLLFGVGPGVLLVLLWWNGWMTLPYAAMLIPPLCLGVFCAKRLVLLWPTCRLSARHVALMVPMLILGAAMAYITVRSETEVVNAQGAEWNMTAAQRLMVAGLAPWFYAAKLLLPLKLTFIYPKWQLDSAHVILWAGPLAVVAALALLAFLSRWIGRGPLAAALIFGGALLPALGFFDVFPFRYSYVADHFQYHATPALIALVVALAAAIVGRLVPAPRTESATLAEAGTAAQPSPMPYILTGLLLLVLGVATWVRAGVFDNNLNLWEDTIAKNPDAWMAHNNLAFDLHRLGREQRNLGLLDNANKSFERAAAAASEAVRLKPDHVKALNNWGNALRALGRNDEAMDKYDRAIQLDPTYPDPHYEKGAALASQGKHSQAVESYRRFLELADQTPGVQTRQAMASAHEALADSLVADGQTEPALEEYLKAIELNPRFTDAMKDAAALFARSGRYQQAYAMFARVTEVDPQDVHAWSAAALLLGEAGRLEDATAAIQQALTINPEDPRALQVAGAIIQRWKERGVDPTTRMSTPASQPADPANAKVGERP